MVSIPSLLLVHQSTGQTLTEAMTMVENEVGEPAWSDFWKAVAKAGGSVQDPAIMWAWFAWMESQIWKTTGKPWERIKEVTRELEPSEWSLIRLAVDGLQLPCLLGGGAFGFSTTLKVFDPGSGRQVFLMDSDHLPSSVVAGRGQSYDEKMDLVFAVLSELTHVDANRERLAKIGKLNELVEDKHHYRY